MTSDLRVAVDCRLMFYRRAGIAHYTRRLIQALAALDASSMHLSALLDRRDADVAWVPSNVALVRTLTPAHHKLEATTLPIELARLQIDVLHSPDFITCAGRFRKVITIHDLYFMEHPEAMGADGARYYGRVGWSAAQADRIIAVSDFTRRDIARLLPPAADRTTVIHEAPDDALSAESRSDNSAFILFVGTLEPRKNVSALLRALARLPEDLSLVVAGADGWGEAEPGRLAAELGVRERVSLAGRVSDAELDALYRGARAFAMPSLSEGFGLPVLEAMARGTPVVCADAGALPEVAGDAALLHAPSDDAALAAHVLALWRDDALRAEYSRRGLARAAQFSWRAAAEQTARVYRAAAHTP